MSYTIKEIFYSLQGEGANAGRPAVFCRFSGCNLWDGREETRANAICKFCDTDFVGTNGSNGRRHSTASELAQVINSLWPTNSAHRFVVFTGGEPLLQLDAELIDRLHDCGFQVAVETNGTKEPPSGIDWICVSPKSGTEFLLRQGNELKVVFPQSGIEPAQFEELSFQHFFIQPMDGADAVINRELAVRYCLEHPKWRLSLQTHKLLGIR